MLNAHLTTLNIASIVFLLVLTPYALVNGELGTALGAAGAVLVTNAYFSTARRHL